MQDLTNEGSSYHDVITSTPKLVMILRDEGIIHQVKDPLYKPALKALRDGPKTIKELQALYNVIAPKAKSDKTIYRYVKKLEELGLVMVAGQRVYLGRNITETLYSRTARIFYFHYDDPDLYCEKNIMHAKIIGGLMSSRFGGKVADPKKMIAFVQEYERKKLDIIENLLEQADAEVIDMLSAKEWEGVTFFIDAAATFVLMTELNIDSKLETVFSNSL